jgi:hypothetical protein
LALTLLAVLSGASCTAKGETGSVERPTSLPSPEASGPAAATEAGEMSGAVCPPTATLVPDSTDDERAAYGAGRDFIRAMSRRSYDPRAAWKMLDAWYVDRMDWSGVGDFAGSDIGRPYPRAGTRVSKQAQFVAEVGGPGTLPHPKYRDFILARAGVTRAGCPEPLRDKIAASLWYLTLTPIGGNAPAYVLLVHRASGYAVLSSDI